MQNKTQSNNNSVWIDDMYSSLDTEINYAVKQATKYKELITQAKTQAKKSFYQKKLIRMIADIDQAIKFSKGRSLSQEDTSTSEHAPLSVNTIQTPRFEGTSNVVEGYDTSITISNEKETTTC